MDLLRRSRGTAAYCLMMLALLLALGLAPPESGRMLVIPLAGAPEGALLAATLAQGGRLVSAGPLNGSLVIDGDRAALAPALIAFPAFIIAAPATGCAGTLA